jgi:hypothetical protein
VYQWLHSHCAHRRLRCRLLCYADLVTSAKQALRTLLSLAPLICRVTRHYITYSISQLHPSIFTIFHLL